MYNPSVFSRTSTRSTPVNFSPVRTVFAGRTLAYRSKACRSATLIERNPFPSAVSSGPFSASLVRRMLSSVAAGSGSLTAATAAAPASWRSHVMSARAASSRRTVASVIEGPMPSPGISVTERDMLSLRALRSDDQVRDARRERADEVGWHRGCRIGTDLAEPDDRAALAIREGELHHDDLLRALAREPRLDRHERVARVRERDEAAEIADERLGKAIADLVDHRAQRLHAHRVRVAHVVGIALRDPHDVRGVFPAPPDAPRSDDRGDGVVELAAELVPAAGIHPRAAVGAQQLHREHDHVLRRHRRERRGRVG